MNRVISLLTAALETPSDRQLLDRLVDELSRVVGCKALPIPLDEKRFLDLLDRTALAQAPEAERSTALDAMRQAFRVLERGETYSFAEQTFGSFKLPVHNQAIAKLLRESYSLTTLHSCVEHLEEKGVFSFRVDPATGLVRTSDSDENWRMGGRQWVTDFVMCGYWQRDHDPDGWKKALLVNAALALGPISQHAVSTALANPSWFRETTEDYHNYLLRGVPHIFLPGSITFDQETGLPDPASIAIDVDWFNQRRLESQAHLLHALIGTTLADIVDGARWGFSSSELQKPDLRAFLSDAIRNLAAYLIQINRDPNAPNSFDCRAPSASSWEEHVFDEGMTSDTALIVLAVRALYDFLYSSSYEKSPEIVMIRKRLFDCEETQALFLGSTLKSIISAGELYVAERVVAPLGEGRPARQSRERCSDTSLTFLAAFHYRLDSNPRRNAELYLQLLDQLERDLLKPHGMIRFAPHLLDDRQGKQFRLVDSYLGIGYWLPESLRAVLLRSSAPQAVAGFGSKDSSSIEQLLIRQKNVAEGTEAMWCLGLSATLQGLAWLLQDILCAPSTQRNGAEGKIVERLTLKLNEYINRNLALISGGEPGALVTKSNGYPCPPYRVLEAYEYVPSLEQGKYNVVPGAHPLAWGAAQLYDALKAAIAALKIREEGDSLEAVRKS